MVKAAKKLLQIPLSDNAMQSSIDDIGIDILHQVVSDIKASFARISVRLDELAHVSNCRQLMVLLVM